MTVQARKLSLSQIATGKKVGIVIGRLCLPRQKPEEQEGEIHDHFTLLTHLSQKSGTM